MDPIISVNNVAKQYAASSYVFSDISFRVGRGEWLSIVGKSGIGKSTLLGVLAGTEQSSSGEVTINGSIALVPQRELLLPWRTVLENVLLPCELGRSRISERDLDRAREMLQDVELHECTSFFPSELSGGMKQRVALVRAMMLEREIFLMDEPFSAVDFNLRLKIGTVIRRFSRLRNQTVIHVTHNFEEAIALSDRILVMSGTPARMVQDLRIDLPEELRDPVSVRRWSKFSETFEIIWQKLEEN